MKILGRRGFLAGAGVLAAAGGSACAPAARPDSVAPSELYIGLGRAREVAILDAISDRVVGRIPLESLGDQGAPAQISVGPSGSAAVLPLVTTKPAVGIIQQNDAPPASQKPGAAATRVTRQTALLRLGARGRSEKDGGTSATVEAAQRMTADSRGMAYVLLADASAQVEPEVAVIEMRTGKVRRRFQIAQADEAVLALQADAGGERLYASIWTWGDRRHLSPAEARGRLVAIDPASGTVVARAPLPNGCAVTDLLMATAAPGAPAVAAGGQALFGVLETPGPNRDETLAGTVERRHVLATLDTDFLDVQATWELTQRPGAISLTPDGRRAYLLGGSGLGRWARDLMCLDLASGQLLHHWQLPEGCFAMALSPVGKLYIADAMRDRLWRLDVQRNVPLGDLPLPGAPLALAARPA